MIPKSISHLKNTKNSPLSLTPLPHPLLPLPPFPLRHSLPSIVFFSRLSYVVLLVSLVSSLRFSILKQAKLGIRYVLLLLLLPQITFKMLLNIITSIIVIGVLAYHTLLCLTLHIYLSITLFRTLLMPFLL